MSRLSFGFRNSRSTPHGVSPKGWYLLAVVLLCFAGCKRDPSVVAQEHYARAQELLKQDKVEAGIIELNRAVQAKPDLAKAHHDLAKIYLKQGKLTDGFREYSLAIRYNPQDQEAYYVVGDMLLAGHEFSQAKNIATQILSNWPGDRRGNYLLAESEMGLGDWDLAEEAVKQNAEDAPQEARAHFDLAALAVHQEKWAEAESQLRLSWRLDPKPMATPLSLAQLLASRGNYQGAQDVLNQLSADQPRRTEPLFALANLYLQQRKLPEAEQTFKRIQTAAPDNAATRIALGEFYLGTRNLKAAETEFRRLTAQYPDDALAWHHLADTDLMLNQREDARRIAKDLLGKNAQDWQALTLLGQMDIDEGKISQAEQELNQAKALKTDSAAISFQLARVYLLQGKTDQAKFAISQSLRNDANYAPARTLQAGLELRAGQPDLAIRDLNAALQRTPTALQPNLMISEAYAQQGQFAQAENTLQRILAQANTPAVLAMTLQTLAQVKFQQKNYPEAIQFARKSLDTGLINAQALRVLGMSYVAQKRPDLAIPSVQSYLGKANGWAAGQNVLGDVALEANRLDTAEAAYQKQLEIAPNSASALLGLGEIYDRLQQYDKSREFLERFAAADPTNATVHVRLGILAERRQDFPGAIAEYKKAISIDASNGPAKNNLAWLYAEHGGDIDDALRLAREARAVLPGDPSVADTLGWVFLKKGMPDKAVPLFQECSSKNPASATYHYHLGMAYFQLGKKPEAATQLRAALQKGQAFSGAAQARETLEQISSSP